MSGGLGDLDRLPIELRYEIYRYCVDDNFSFTQSWEPGVIKVGGWVGNWTVPQPREVDRKALSHVSEEIRDELRACVYEPTTFELTTNWMNDGCAEICTYKTLLQRQNYAMEVTWIRQLTCTINLPDVDGVLTKRMNFAAQAADGTILRRLLRGLKWLEIRLVVRQHHLDYPGWVKGNKTAIKIQLDSWRDVETVRVLLVKAFLHTSDCAYDVVSFTIGSMLSGNMSLVHEGEYRYESS